MRRASDLSATLKRIDGRGYKAYKDIAGGYTLDGGELHIDYVQGDPFAAPSKLRIRLSAQTAKLPEDLFDTPVRRIALCDYLARAVRRAIRDVGTGGRGSGKSGQIMIDAGGQEVLDRTAIKLCREWVEARLSVGLPAQGRSVRGRQAEAMLLGDVPKIARAGLTAAALDLQRARTHVNWVDNQEFIRAQLEPLGLIAFVGDGALLPRESGASDRPLHKGAVPFVAPQSLRVKVKLRWPVDGKTELWGMGIPKGVTVIVGGGYHGKSTLLKALERSVYPHIPGDGREQVVTCADAVKIRAEDGRRVENVDISAFINNLPHGRSTTSFRSEDASGSTSQAANIAEALELGAKALLLDEDTSATNFMVRDARMQALVAKQHEPITPFLDRVRDLSQAHGVSTVLVMGGSGDYFDPADTVIMMREYLPQDVTAEAKEIAGAHKSGRAQEVEGAMRLPRPRVPLYQSLDPSKGRKDVKIDVKEVDLLLFGAERVELRCVEQLVDMSQTRAVGYAMELCRGRLMNHDVPMREVIDQLMKLLEAEGLDALNPRYNPSRPRRATPGKLRAPPRLRGRLRAQPAAHAQNAPGLRPMLDLKTIQRLLREHEDALERPLPTFTVGDQTLDFERQRYIMGVVNLSKDSQNKETVCTTTEEAVARALRLAQEGAQIIDLGAESTRIEAQRVSPAAQIEQLVPVVKRLTEAGLTSSIDTYYPEVLEACAQAGTRIFNLTGAKEADRAFELAAKHSAAVIICYVAGLTPREHGELSIEQDLWPQIEAYFEDLLARAHARGATQCVVDPGLGFKYKNLEEGQARTSFQLHTLISTFRLRKLGCPTLNILPWAPLIWGGDGRASEGMFALITWLGGTNIIRTHNVPEVRRVLQLLESCTA